MSKTNSIETPKGRARFTFSDRLIEELSQLTPTAQSNLPLQ